MSKSKEELNTLKKEIETVKEKLHELIPEELEQVTGGANSCGIFMDEDVAEEATTLAMAQVLQQAHQEMLAQANSQAAKVLGLLQ